MRSDEPEARSCAFTYETLHFHAGADMEMAEKEERGREDYLWREGAKEGHP
jgi:hypothetical protein